MGAGGGGAADNGVQGGSGQGEEAPRPLVWAVANSWLALSGALAVFRAVLRLPLDTRALRLAWACGLMALGEADAPDQH